MKFLLDQNVSPALVDLLADADHVAEHIRDLGMRRPPDDVVLAAARDAEAVLISSDTDFGELLARSNTNEPSVILLRRQEGRRVSEIASLILANLGAVADDPASGWSSSSTTTVSEFAACRSGPRPRPTADSSLDSSPATTHGNDTDAIGRSPHDVPPTE